MVEICCDVVTGNEESAAVCEPRSRVARRKRMEIRRFRFVGGTELIAPATAAAESSRKRQRLDFSASFPAILHADPNTGTVRGSGDGASSSNPASSSNQPPSAAELAVSDQCPRYGMTSVCGRRRDMEDAVSIRPALLRRVRPAPGSFHFFGVYDGHGCSHVADSCRDRMHGVVAEEIERLGSGTLPVLDWKEVMESSFSRMDCEAVQCSGGHRDTNCRCELQTPMCDHVGSTAVVAVVSPDRIVVANCGDSRAVLCRKGIPVPLSCDHKPDRPDELQRIEAAGGRVIYWEGARVLGVLAMSRAIGDNYLKPFVIPEPEVTITERTEEDECLILASDGLWDVVSNEMACDIARMCLQGNARDDVEHVESGGRSDKACSDAAMLLTKLALARQSADNVSVVVIDLKRT